MGGAGWGDDWEEVSDVVMGDSIAPATRGQAIVVELLDSSSDEEDATLPVPEAGPAPWADSNNPRCSYLYLPNDERLTAAELHEAESVLLPREGGSRRTLPWGGWNESKIIARPEKGIFCTAGGAQCLWDGEWLNDEVRRRWGRAGGGGCFSTTYLGRPPSSNRSST